MSDAPQFGTIVTIDEHTVMVIGQPLDVDKNQPDVANSLVHQTGTDLVVVDSGATEGFREPLRAAIGRFEGWHRLILITTHGHVDHVGNNDLVDEIGDELGRAVEHWFSASGAAQMADPVTYWRHSFERITGVGSLPAPPALAAKKIVSLFQPLHPFGRTTRALEGLPLERLTLGSVPVTGWTLADGAVQVIRSQGHCAGHVIVHLKDANLIHMGDESIGGFGSMQDADQLKIQSVLGAVGTGLAEGAITTITEGHSADVLRSEQASSHIDELLDQAIALDAAAVELTAHRERVEAGEFAVQFGERISQAGIDIDPHSPFNAMIAVGMLGERGYSPGGHGSGSPWQRPAHVDPEHVDGMPHGLAVVPAAVAMVNWKLRSKAPKSERPE